MVGHVADDLRVLLQPLRLRVVGHLRELGLVLLEVCVVLHIGLDFGVFRQAPHLGRLGHRGRLRFRDVRFAVRELVEPFVGLHAEGHAALLALETPFVPYLVQTFQLLQRVHRLLTPCAPFTHFPDYPLELLLPVNDRSKHRSESSQA